MSTRQKIVVLAGVVGIAVLAAWFVMSGNRSRVFTGRSEIVPQDDTTAAPVTVVDSASDMVAPASDETVAKGTESDIPKETITDTKKSAPIRSDSPVADTKSISGPTIVDRLVSFGYESRSSRDIDTIVIHSSYDALGSDPYSVQGVIAEYKQAGVSPHYLVDRKGTIYRLVEDRDVAYHAGVSKMPDGRTGVNEFSIGIEAIGKDTDSPTSAQYTSLRSLIASLKGKYPIKSVLGHSDIAPGRKSDPWGFDWKEMK
ncbi:MAG: N-acetylmuramoyl-L-alanine amidase [Candidatus Moraniibacteriota bacterium]